MIISDLFGVPGSLPANADPSGNTPAVPLTHLLPGQERDFQAWERTLPQRLAETNDYDLRGFWKSQPEFRLDKEGQHLTDEFKLPNHDTFSNESRYYNADTAPYGGRWDEHKDHSWSFLPNDTTKKSRIDEDANGNRISLIRLLTGSQ